MSQDKPLLSLIICTYDRCDLLVESVKSILLQLDFHQEIELIIVNNSPSISFEKALNLAISGHPRVKLVEESKLGLSHARNTGIYHSQGQWCGFMDDDALIGENFIRLALTAIRQDKYHCFGGSIVSWWKYDRPRWLSPDFGSLPLLSQHEIILDKAFLWGSNLFIRRDVLLEIGGFPYNVGMFGKKIGYGAETLVQQALRDKGYTIGYIPELLVHHLVNKYKLKLRWHLISAYATARDGKYVFPQDYELKGFLKTLRRLVAAPIKGLYRWITSPQYYWENWLLDSLKPWFILYGKLEAIVA